MKNLSLILNGVLAIAVAILFYQVNTLKTSNHVTEQLDNADSSASKVTINEIGPTNLAEAKMAFINIDSINSSYLYIADYAKKSRNQMQNIESQIESLTVSFQNEYQSYQESAQRGVAPQSQLEAMEKSLQAKEQEIKNKQIALQELQYKQQDEALKLNEKLQQVVDTYNNGKFDYVFTYSESVPFLVFKNKKLDITADIVKILNDEYNAKKKK